MLGVNGLFCWVLGVECWVLGGECWVLMACFVGCWVLSTGF